MVNGIEVLGEAKISRVEGRPQGDKIYGVPPGGDRVPGGYRWGREETKTTLSPNRPLLIMGGTKRVSIPPIPSFRIQRLTSASQRLGQRRCRRHGAYAHASNRHCWHRHFQARAPRKRRVYLTGA